MSAYYALASLGLCALMGYAGQISLGQAGFFAIGAYASAFISKSDPSISPWIACPCAVLLAALVAALIGTPVLRLKGHYLAMATLGFGLVIEKIVRGTKAFGGADGLSSVPAFPLLPGLVVTGRQGRARGELHDLLGRPRPRPPRPRQPRRLARGQSSARPPRRRGGGRRDGRRRREATSSTYSSSGRSMRRSRGSCSRTTTAASAPARRT